MSYCPACGSAITFQNVKLTCGCCGGPCCEQCGTPYESYALCRKCMEKHKQINLLPEAPEEEDDF